MMDLLASIINFDANGGSVKLRFFSHPHNETRGVFVLLFLGRMFTCQDIPSTIGYSTPGNARRCVELNANAEPTADDFLY